MEQGTTQFRKAQETKLQSDCFLWFWNTFPEHRQMLFHVQNKASNAIEGNKFKSMGVVKGISDFVLILYNEVAFIELKNENGNQSMEQKVFERKVTERNHMYFVVRGFAEFKNLVLSLLKTYGNGI